MPSIEHVKRIDINLDISDGIDAVDVLKLYFLLNFEEKCYQVQSHQRDEQKQCSYEK